MVRVCDGKDLPKGDRGKTYLLRTGGTTSQEIWDVTDPGAPEPADDRRPRASKTRTRTGGSAIPASRT